MTSRFPVALRGSRRDESGAVAMMSGCWPRTPQRGCPGRGPGQRDEPQAADPELRGLRRARRRQRAAGHEHGHGQAVADYLNQNQAASDGTDCNADAGTTITAAMLTDLNEANGEVTFPTGTTRIRVVAPSARVQFGLAGVMGYDDTCVQSVAVARIASGKLGMAPFYTTDSCDSGPQC